MDAFTEHIISNVYNKSVPKLFVLYVLYCTVSKLHHFGDSPYSFFCLKSFYCWDSDCLDRPQKMNKK